MAISRDKKHALVSEITDVLASSRMMVFAAYQGLTVAELQALRASAREAGVTIKVAKNRLVRVALSKNDKLKDIDTSELTGQLIYAASSEDEVAPAKVIDEFAKTHSALQVAGAISGDAELLSASDVKELAGLPTKDQLIAETIEQLLSPVNEITNGLSGNLHALLDGVEAKAA